METLICDVLYILRVTEKHLQDTHDARASHIKSGGCHTKVDKVVLPRYNQTATTLAFDSTCHTSHTYRRFVFVEYHLLLKRYHLLLQLWVFFPQLEYPKKGGRIILVCK